jgi:hypothetical protein
MIRGTGIRDLFRNAVTAAPGGAAWKIPRHARNPMMDATDLIRGGGER